jgi:hypothetical protein
MIHVTGAAIDCSNRWGKLRAVHTSPGLRQPSSDPQLPDTLFDFGSPLYFRWRGNRLPLSKRAYRQVFSFNKNGPKSIDARGQRIQTSN